VSPLGDDDAPGQVCISPGPLARRLARGDRRNDGAARVVRFEEGCPSGTPASSLTEVGPASGLDRDGGAKIDVRRLWKNRGAASCPATSGEARCHCCERSAEPPVHDRLLVLGIFSSAIWGHQVLLGSTTGRVGLPRTW